MTKDEKNRQIAEGLFGWKMIEGYHPEIDGPRSDPGRWHLRRRWILDGKPMACEECGDFPDFHTDEAANALVLEKMPRGQVSFHPAKFYLDGKLKTESHWVCLPNFVDDKYLYVSNPDRKTAICEAALKFIDALSKA